jgi:hypothetical protein
MSLSKLNAVRLDMLNGCEVQSIKHEGCVLISGSNLHRDGEVIETLDENKKVSYLWNKYAKEEGL